MAEWLKARAWKARSPQGVGGSNPPPSAIKLLGHEAFDLYGFHGLSFSLYHTHGPHTLCLKCYNITFIFDGKALRELGR